MALTLSSTPVRTAGHVQPSLPRVSARVAAATLGSVFLLLTVDAVVNSRAFFDLRMIRAVQRIDLPLLAEALRPVDRLTSGPGAVLMWTLTLTVFATARWWVPALTLLALPAGGVINELIGVALVGRTRPGAEEVERVIGHTDAPSFPSGHVMGAVMLYGFLFVVADRIGNRAVRVAIKVSSVAIIAITGFGRVWYGAHWPTDVLGAYMLGGLLLLGLVAVYRRVDAAAGDLPLIRAASPPHDESLPHAHALTSVVLFNGDSVSKIYAPGLLPRALYWLAFQASFPYIANRAALRAAMYRRNLAALLSEYWFGTNRVARVTSIDRLEGGYALTSERVDGQAPRDRAAAKAFLVELRDRFEEAGLPTWQIDPRQPRAVDNVLETADGTYQIVDLESGLVAPIASLKTWRRALRRGAVPLYDDVFFDITRAYLGREEAALRAALGEAGFAELTATLEAAETEAMAWHRSEPRVWSRLVRGLWSGFGVRRWPAWLKAKFSGSQEQAQAWMAKAVATWEAEGRVTAAEAAEMRAQMETPAFQTMMPHLGAHLIISILLRFPFGSIARVAWSAGALGVATARLLARRSDRRAWALQWSIHSPLVIVLSAIPGFGTFAYLAARPVRQNRLLLRATADAVLKKVPWRLYARTRLERIIARPASSQPVPAAVVTPEWVAPEVQRVPQAPFVPALAGLPSGAVVRFPHAESAGSILPRRSGGRYAETTAAGAEQR